MGVLCIRVLGVGFVILLIKEFVGGLEVVDFDYVFFIMVFRGVGSS